MESPSTPAQLPEQSQKALEPMPAATELSPTSPEALQAQQPRQTPQPHQAPPPQPEGASALSLALRSALKNLYSLPREQRTAYLGVLTSERLDAITRVIEQYLPSLQPDLDTLHNLLIAASEAALSTEQETQLKETYERLHKNVFPVNDKYLYWCHQFHGLSEDHSLRSISWDHLKRLEEESYADDELKALVQELKLSFGRVKDVSDSQGLRQVFEYYGEALVYSKLSKHFYTKRIVAKQDSMPDFVCVLPDGKTFYVELKSLDLVQAPLRSDQMHEDAMNQNIEIEDQLLQGNKVAMAEREIAPFKPPFDDGSYDPRSLLLVINTLMKKARGAFKESQFAQGPTFAFMLCDRLMIPGGNHSVAPQYFERGGDAVVSGALWNACFARMGWPIFRMPDFEGEPGLEGHMTEHGLFVDEYVKFPTGAVVFSEFGWQEDTLMGLYDSKWQPTPEWTVDDTAEVIHVLCTAYNDERNSYGQSVAMT
ncbi:hypothetical protein [Pseudomonas putida]|uniref:hypothetical protein n=1 Tax=Pseudomonas putida TaxID=303 RepID=UPI003F8A76F7